MTLRSGFRACWVNSAGADFKFLRRVFNGKMDAEITATGVEVSVVVPFPSSPWFMPQQ